MDLVVSIPDKVEALASIFRCSGRMFWPVYYLLILFLLFIYIRSYKKKTVMAILLGILVLQVVDTSAGWGPKKQANSVGGKTWTEPFKSPFWEVAASHYKKIRIVPSGVSVIHKNQVAYFAARHKMATDAAYLARYDTEKQDKLDEYDFYLLNTGNYETDTLYLIAIGLSDADMAMQYLNMAMQHLKSGRDLSTLVDGYIVIAPGWNYGTDSRSDRVNKLCQNTNFTTREKLSRIPVHGIILLKECISRPSFAGCCFEFLKIH
jgi:hypothetical protein